MKDIRADEIITELNLLQHPEGGWFSETYRSSDEVRTDRGIRQLATVIYFMLKGHEKSAFHRLKSDEFWYFHQGSSLTVHIIYEDGVYKEFPLGLIGDRDSVPHLYLPAGCWFAAECRNKDSFSLLSCSVHPGFDFEDFELAREEDLKALYLERAELISEFCIN